ncbi:TlpA family protein disulfide reductase [Paenalcaligenes niemegkensis]|uniref:TlpA disulfide reductase family protein n=1 Tax=Paenalcaligenes niemegkensis TaxID=2895469 RepID=UPI001EE7B0AF|nr:TlpA disulfide reductase family protein [Paenalcaligenes niemegkensis]MCQ9616229.1 TlpA family protein disulfide reductase [Paenalcaligenes niemegkensis]
MPTVSLGPFVLGASVFLSFLSLLVTMGAAVLFERLYKVRLEALVWWTAIAGVVAGRFSFVMQYWDSYRNNVWSVFDIRDGGMVWHWALFAIAAVVLVALFRHKGMARRGITLCLFAGLSSWGAGYAYLNLQHDALQSLPSLSLLSLADDASQHVQLDSYRGKPVVLNLWATWCPPCRREMPVFQAAQQQYEDVHFVFANQMESADKVLEFMDEEKLLLHNLLQDESGELSQFAKSKGLPTTLFIDASGQVQHVRMGEVSEASLRHQLSSTLSATR